MGVCLGHQIIGQVFKSKIIGAKNLMHGKTSIIKHKNKGLMKNIQNNFVATRYHSLIVDKKNFGTKKYFIFKKNRENKLLIL